VPSEEKINNLQLGTYDAIQDINSLIRNFAWWNVFCSCCCRWKQLSLPG